MSSPPVPGGGRPPVGETERERLNRNFDELLQELRVLQTGVQILLAFMLTVPFAAGFERLSDAQRDVYGLTLVLVGAATALLVGPVAAHRMTFRRRLKPQVVLVAHHMMLAGLGVLLVAIVLAVGLAATAALPDGRALAITVALAAVLLVSWVAVPLVVRWKSPLLRQVERHGVGATDVADDGA